MLVEELRNWIQEHGIDIPAKLRRKGGRVTLVSCVRIKFRPYSDLITAILNASVFQQPTLADIEELVSYLTLNMYLKLNCA